MKRWPRVHAHRFTEDLGVCNDWAQWWVVSASLGGDLGGNVLFAFAVLPFKRD